MKLTTEDLEALNVGALVRGAPGGFALEYHVYEKVSPPGPNGPWRRQVTEGPDAGKWVTCASSTLALMGVVRA